MRTKTSASIVVAALALAVVLPGMASAHDKGRAEVKASAKADVDIHEKGIRIFEHKNKDRGFGTDSLNLFYKGTVTAVSSTGFTMKDKNGVSTTVNTAGAAYIRVPRTPITLSDIRVNDSVWVTGTKSGTAISASVVYAMSENVRPAVGKGTVAAISGSTLTLQTKNNATVTVQTTVDTQVLKQDGTAGATTDVQVGSKVKLWGLWDKVASVFSALKIKIKS